MAPMAGDSRECECQAAELVTAPHDTPERISALYRCHTTALWAKSQLTVLFDMAIDRGLPGWFSDELKRIQEGIATIKGN